MPPDKIQLTVVVNGQEAPVEGNANAPLHTIVAKALADTQNTGQGPDNWELRDGNGVVLDLGAKVGSFGFEAGTRLFLNLKAGIGGA